MFNSKKLFIVFTLLPLWVKMLIKRKCFHFLCLLFQRKWWKMSQSGSWKKAFHRSSEFSRLCRHFSFQIQKHFELFLFFCLLSWHVLSLFVWIVFIYYSKWCLEESGKARRKTKIDWNVIFSKQRSGSNIVYALKGFFIRIQSHSVNDGRMAWLTQHDSRWNLPLDIVHLLITDDTRGSDKTLKKFFH